MITAHNIDTNKSDLWSKLAAPLPKGVISWRQDGRPGQRDGKFFSRFVAYIEANTVRERLDSVCPGEWDLTLELLPPLPVTEDGEDTPVCSFKARLQILGVIREDVGVGKDYKQAATDAFKRVAVRFGVAHELYAYEQNWVQMDGDGRYAKPLEDPQAAYDRRYGSGTPAMPPSPPVLLPNTPQRPAAPSPTPAPAEPRATDEVTCPKCGGRTWDNRASKKNPKAPDYKCRDRSCDGVVWPPREAKPATRGHNHAGRDLPGENDELPAALRTGTDDLPF